MRRLALAAVLALLLSVVFAWPAWYFRMKPVQPNEDTAILFNPAYVRFMSYTEIAEGFAVAGAVMLLIWAGSRLRRAMPSIDHLLARPVVVSEAVERLVLLLSIVAAGAYSFFAFLDAAHWIGAYYGGPTTNGLALFAGHLGEIFSIYGKAGEAAFLAAALATLGFAAHRLEKGWALAIRWAFRSFTLPAIIALMVGLLLCYNPPTVVMADHVADFANWSLGGVYVLSNWTVLAISVSLEALLLSEPEPGARGQKALKLRKRPHISYRCTDSPRLLAVRPRHLVSFLLNMWKTLPEDLRTVERVSSRYQGAD